MKSEFDALCHNHAWTLVLRPPNTNVVRCKWVFKTKHHPDSYVDKYKARLVARGFTQQSGLDYQDTLSPVVKPAIIRIIISFVVVGASVKLMLVMSFSTYIFNKQCTWPNHQVSNILTFRHIFANFREPAIYGLTKAPRAWYARLTASVGFYRVPCQHFPVCFPKGGGNNLYACVCCRHCDSWIWEKMTPLSIEV